MMNAWGLALDQLQQIKPTRPGNSGPGPDAKVCTKCKELKPISHFYRRNGLEGDDRRSECKACTAGYLRRWRAAVKATKGTVKVEREVECDACGKPFVTVIKRAKCCSGKCRAKLANDRKKFYRIHGYGGTHDGCK